MAAQRHAKFPMELQGWRLASEVNTFGINSSLGQGGSVRRGGALIVVLMALGLGGCLTASQQAPVQPITCRVGADCDLRWSRAVKWVALNSYWQIQTQTTDLIQTMGPSREVQPAFKVTKLETAPGTYEITFSGGCGDWFRCVPTVDESRASFRDFVMR